MKKRRIIIILLIILLIVVLSLIIIKLNIRTPRQNLDYINSNEIDEGTFSPQMIHVVVASYEGDLNPKAISKSAYYFLNTVIPKYLKECNDSEKYFEKNKDAIKLDIGVTNSEEFSNLMQEIKKLSGNLEYESSRFDADNIKKDFKGLKTTLYIKYKNNPEISFDITISDKIQSDRNSVKFSK